MLPVPPGTLLKRHRIPKPAPQDEEFYGVDDFNVGGEVTFYGRTFRLCDCDEFTRKFLTKLGIRVGEPEAMPDDPYTSHRDAEEDAMQPLRPYERRDKLGKFLAHDGQVLRFQGLWDDRESVAGEKHHLVVLYYLADDTVEVTEKLAPNSGRTQTQILKRQPLPRRLQPLPLPGAVADRTLLNTFGDVGTGHSMIDRFVSAGMQGVVFCVFVFLY